MHAPLLSSPGPDERVKAETDLVLVVDDTLLDATLAQGLVEQRNSTRVITASSGEAALEVIERESPDLVVTDLQMLGMNGLELVEAIQQRYSWLPTILMTAHGSEALAAEALRLGAASYVRKQDLASRLRETVDDVLAITGTRRQQERIRVCWRETQFSFRLENDIALVRQMVSHLQQYAKSMLRIDDNEIARVGVTLLSHAPEVFAEAAEWLEGDQGKTVYALKPGVKQSLAYDGRTGIFEILTMTQKLRQSLTEGDSADEMDSKILEEEMFDFHRVALLKAAKGITSFDELQRVVPVLDTPLGISE